MISKSVRRCAAGRPPRVVYRSFREALEVLSDVATARPAWWTPPCGEFVAYMQKHASRLENLMKEDTLPYAHDVMCFEGLDGVGKTTITKHIAKSLNATLIVSPPPRWAMARERFREQPEEVARAFYSACNYDTADEVVKTSRLGPVVLDRWYLSTLCNALAHRTEPLPDECSILFQWPLDLPPFSRGLGFFLTVPEEVRVARTHKRGALETDEKALEANAELRRKVTTAYERTKLLSTIERPNWRAAVNAIYAELREHSRMSVPIDFTPEEVAEISPY